MVGWERKREKKWNARDLCGRKWVVLLNDNELSRISRCISSRDHDDIIGDDRSKFVVWHPVPRCGLKPRLQWSSSERKFEKAIRSNVDGSLNMFLVLLTS